MMNTRIPIFALALSLLLSCAATTGQFPGSIENLDRSGLAIQGYDPVTYFVEGGGIPAKGEAARTAAHDGATYQFVSEANRELFLQDPHRYVPRYGGWCAWAMIEGELIEVDPESYLIEDGGLYLFYDGWLADTRELWLELGGETNRPAANANWGQLSESLAR